MFSRPVSLNYNTQVSSITSEAGYCLMDYIINQWPGTSGDLNCSLSYACIQARAHSRMQAYTQTHTYMSNSTNRSAAPKNKTLRLCVGVWFCIHKDARNVWQASCLFGFPVGNRTRRLATCNRNQASSRSPCADVPLRWRQYYRIATLTTASWCMCVCVL